MNSIVILFLIIAFYSVRIFILRAKGRRVNFLWVSFFIFCLPFEISKTLTEPVVGLFTGTLGSTFYLTLPIMMILVLIPFVRWKNINFQVKYNDWVSIVIVFILISLINPYNISTRGTIIFAGFFISNILLCKVIKSFISKDDIIEGIFDGFLLLSVIQLVLAICFPLLGISEVTKLFHEVASDAATRHDSNRVGAVGTFQHPGNLAFFSVLTSSFFLSAYLNQYRKKTSFWIMFCIAATIMLTYSRTSYLAYIVVMIALIYINRNAKKNIFSLSSIFKLFLPISMVVIWLIFFSPLSENFLKSDTSEQYDNRMVHYLMAFDIFQKSPIIGVGLNAHLAYVSKNFYIASVFTMDNFFTENPIHNIHLIVLTETGVLGLFFWIIFVFRNIGNAKKDIAQNRNQILSLTLIGMLIAYLFYGMTGWTPFSRGVFPLFLFITYFSISFRNQKNGV